MSDISRRAGFGHVEIKDPHDLVACKVQWVGEHCRRHLGLGMITLIKTANTRKALNIFFFPLQSVLFTPRHVSPQLIMSEIGCDLQWTES